MTSFFKKSYTEEELQIFRFLSKSFLFSTLTHSELSRFSPYLYKREYHKNEVVFFRGDPSQALYLIRSGSVEMSLDLNQNMEYLTTAYQPQSFGDNALLPNSFRLYNAVVNSDIAEILVLPQANLHGIMAANPIIKSKMHVALCVSYNNYMNNLFKSYRSAQGFFDLGTSYQNS